MNIVLDIQALQSDAHATRGIGRYAAEFAQALLDVGAPIDTLACNPALAPASPGVVPSSLSASGRVAWNTPERLSAAGRRGPVVYHILSPFESEGPPDGVVPPQALGLASALVVTLHDAIPFRFPERYQPTASLRRFFHGRAALVRSADLVLTNSRHTAGDAVSVLGVDPSRVEVAGTGASSFFTPGDDNDDAVLASALPALRQPFVLTVSGFDPRKDPETLIQAFARLPPEIRRAHQLVIACDLPPGAEEQWSAAINAAGLSREVVLLTGRVSDPTLRALYRRARLFAFTSRAEGFGIPVLEAVCCGCVAVTSDAFAVPEVLDEPASVFPAGDAEALTHLLDRALTSDGFRATLSKAGARAVERHTWRAAADRALRAYEATIERTAPARRRDALRPRVAFVGPLPPLPSGVAVYSARVIEELVERADVDCFVEGAVTNTAAAASQSVRRFPIRALGHVFSPWSYDAVVYALGNSEFHRETLRLALTFPGVVWLHDASLAGLYLTSFGLYVDDAPAPDLAVARRLMRNAVERCAGPHARDLGGDWTRPGAYVEAGISMTDEVARAARSIIVSTEQARATIAAVVREAPVRVIPLAIPDFGPFEPSDDGSEPWIVSMGWVDAIKRPDDLVRMIAALRQDVPARLALVGRATEEQRRELGSLAAELGCKDAVTITGFVSDAEYAAWLARATCVVLLRRGSHGEGSAAIADALAAARPVVTNIPTARELPRGVVDLLDVDVSVATLTDAVRRVLIDERHRELLIDNARKYAESWRFPQVVEALLEVVLAAPRPEYPCPLGVAT